MADVLGKKISELAETTDLAGLYTIGSDKNNQSKKVSLQMVKEAADYANAQGDYAKTVGDSVQGNTGVDEYPVFSASSQYAAGDVVLYDGRLYKFTALHAAGAWVGTDAVETSIKDQTDSKLTELSVEINQVSNSLSGVFNSAASKNLFNSAHVKVNTRAGLDEGTRAGCLASEWIVVENGYYTLSNKQAAGAAYVIALKDANGTITSSNKNISPNTSYTFLIDGAVAVQIGPYSVENASKIYSCQLEKGQQATDYVPGGEVFTPSTEAFRPMFDSEAAIFNEDYEEGGSLTILSMADGKPTSFGYRKSSGAGMASALIEHGKNLYNSETDSFGPRADGTGVSTGVRCSDFIKKEPIGSFFVDFTDTPSYARSVPAQRQRSRRPWRSARCSPSAF